MDTCLQVNVTNATNNLRVTIKIDDIQNSISVLNQPVKISATNITPKLKVSGHLVCSVGGGDYLRVVPDVIWLTPDMLSEEFDIYSNVVWKIDAKDVDNGGDEPTILSMLDNSTYLYNEYYLKNSI